MANHFEHYGNLRTISTVLSHMAPTEVYVAENWPGSLTFVIRTKEGDMIPPPGFHHYLTWAISQYSKRILADAMKELSVDLERAIDLAKRETIENQGT